MESFDVIEAFVTDRIGLVIREKDRQNFEKTIQSRLKVKQQTGREYLAFLKQQGQQVDEEWDRLHFALTVGESYFFRDQGQMDLLREVIFPALIRENKSSRRLRIWSAGCSTGEEPYSLAMMLDGMLPDRESWDLQILATDLNKFALEKARAGLYPEWSFRKMPADRRQKYFKQAEYDWQLDNSIRKMVEFRSGNLALDKIPDAATGLLDLDFIFCRNVFIYFNRETVEKIAQRMSRALRPGGYFMSGHGELFNMSLPELRVEMHPSSVIYRRLDGPGQSNIPTGGAATATSTGALPGGPLPAPVRPATPPRNPAPRTAPAIKPLESVTGPVPPPVSAGEPKSPPPAESSPQPVATTVASGPEGDSKSAVPESEINAPGDDSARDREFLELEDLLRKHRYQDLIQRAGPADSRSGADPSLYLLARAEANLGNHSAALAICDQALAADQAWTDIMLLQAHIIEESGHPDRALEILRRVLYLAPENIQAYLEMAEIYTHQGAPDRARKQQETALSILKKLNSGTEIDRYEGISAGDLIRDLEGLLARNHE